MTEPTSGTGDVLLQLAARLREDQVFGPPVQRDGVTVVPVAHVRAGGGAGGAAHREPHQTNGGFGFVARPAGAWIVEDSGTVRWQPAVDVTPIASFGRLVPTAALILLGVMERRRPRVGRPRVPSGPAIRGSSTRVERSRAGMPSERPVRGRAPRSWRRCG